MMTSSSNYDHQYKHVHLQKREKKKKQESIYKEQYKALWTRYKLLNLKDVSLRKYVGKKKYEIIQKVMVLQLSFFGGDIFEDSFE